jgi:hypothetical protein
MEVPAHFIYDTGKEGVPGHDKSDSPFIVSKPLLIEKDTSLSYHQNNESALSFSQELEDVACVNCLSTQWTVASRGATVKQL